MKKILLVTASLLVVSSINTPSISNATSCPELRVVFARGSGAGRWDSSDYLSFKESLDKKLETTELDYQFIDLDYPAIGVGIENIGVTVGAFVGGGETYEFGESINTGVNNLVGLINDSCVATKYVLGGYSQGAMVISKALGKISSSKIIYAATFGDPKLYLPEGEGIIPAACKGENLSDYRIYVPDCQAYKGLLGALMPYESSEYVGKLGTWCNKRDIFCSSKFNISDHLGYEKDGLYEDASRLIFSTITTEFGIENHISSPHDTAFLIDATGSMDGMIDKYKLEAARLAEQTLSSGGRVALYTYRDLDEFDTALIKLCDFNECNTIDSFKEKLGEIIPEGGGDNPESLLYGAFNMMKTLKWKCGSTKSLVVLTDAGYHSPDLDGTSLDDVVKLSKSIDPVNFYIITNKENQEEYAGLAQQTDGAVETDFGKLNLLTDKIMQRMDSLPKVEEGETIVTPKLTLISQKETSGGVTLKFGSTGEKTLVIINDKILGTTDEDEIAIYNLDKRENNVVILVPIRGDIRGEPLTISLEKNEELFVPLTPNTGGY